MNEDLFSRTISYDPVKEIQTRVTINEFRGIQYLHIRRYFLDFEGEWVPTKEGISMPLQLSNTLALFLALSEIMSEAELDTLEPSLRSIISTYLDTVQNE